MKDALTLEEFKALAELFFNAGKSGEDFESVFTKVTRGEEKKYPIGGYAPGNYTNRCCSCGDHFQGDKSAVQCEPCAVKGKAQFDAMTDEQKEEHWNKVREEMAKLFPITPNNNL